MPRKKPLKAIHKKLKEAKTGKEELDEVAKKSFSKYSEETCPICHSRYDEDGRCACGAGGT